MKTIKIGTEIKRVSNDEAAKLVSCGYAKYVAKSDWKSTRPKPTEKKP